MAGENTSLTPQEQAASDLERSGVTNTFGGGSIFGRASAGTPTLPPGERTDMGHPVPTDPQAQTVTASNNTTQGTGQGPDTPTDQYPYKSYQRNRLARYRSYSYYFALAICDTSESAESLKTSELQEVWQHPAATPEQGGPYAPRPVPNGKGQYCLLINGSTDANFVITDVNWTSFTAATAAPGDKGTSTAVEGTIKFSEPRGVLLLDQIVACAQSLGSDVTTCCWVLKPFFVGYVNSGPNPRFDERTGDSIGEINDITPIMFYPYDLTSVFSIEGGVYEMSFAAMANGAARLPQFSRAADGFTVNLGQTLADAFTNLQRVVNQSYQKYVACVYDKARELPGFNKDDYIEVKYRILLDNVYGSPKYTLTDKNPSTSDSPQCSSPPKFKGQIGGSVESAIHQIMKMCPVVQEEASPNDTNAIRYNYQISPIVETRNEGGTISYYVVYVVRRVPSPKDSLLTAFSKNQGNQDLLKRVQRNLIEFDYIYTGLNIDVLDFDIKMNMGLAYLQIATSANSYQSQWEAVGSSSMWANPDASYNVNKYGTGTVKTPLFFGGQLRKDGVNTQNPGSKTSQAWSIAKQASLEVAEASMTIAGNTALLECASQASNPSNMLNNMGVGPIPQELLNPNAPGEVGAGSNFSNNVVMAAPTAVNERVQYQGEIPEFVGVPLFARVNIKMPTLNDDLEVFRRRKDYSKNFWFDGYYYIYGIDHSFAAGEFKQTVHMIALQNPVDQLAESQIDKKRTQVLKDIDSCFRNKVVCEQLTQKDKQDAAEAIAARDKAAQENAAQAVEKEKEAQKKNEAAAKKKTADENLQKAIDCTEQAQEKRDQAAKDCKGNDKTSTTISSNAQPTPPPNAPAPPAATPVQAPASTGTQQERNMEAFLKTIAQYESAGKYLEIVNPGTSCNSDAQHPCLTGQLRPLGNTRVWYPRGGGYKYAPRDQIPSGVENYQAYEDTNKPGVPLPSSAAGAYQFIKKTWEAASKTAGVSDFSPESQRKAAIVLVRQRERADVDVYAGRIKTACQKVCREWASTPGFVGQGQRGVPLSQWLATYKSFGGENTET